MTVPPAIAGWMFTSVAVNVPSVAAVPWAFDRAPTVTARERGRGADQLVGRRAGHVMVLGRAVTLG